MHLPPSIGAVLTLAGRLRRTPWRAWATLELSVAEATAVYILGFLLSAPLGIVRQILLNARFGLGPEAAAYYAAARLPETAALLIAGGALTNALIPVLLRVVTRDGEAESMRLVNAVLTALLIVATPFSLGLALAAPWLVRTLLAPGFAPELQALTTTLARIMLIEVLLLMSNAVFAAILLSRNQVLLPMLGIGLRNLTLIGGIVLAMVVPGVGIYGPVVGSILDSLVQLALLTPGLRGRGYRPRLVWAPGNRDLHTTWRLLWPNIIGSIGTYVAAIVDTAFASLTGVTAAVGALTNAWILVWLPVRLIGVAVGQAALPRMALLSTRGDLAALRRLLWRMLVPVCAIGLLATGALVLCGEWLIRLLFERGAFDATAVALTTQMLTIYALGMPVYVVTEVATRALISRFDSLSPMLSNLGQLGLRIVLLRLLIVPYGPAAIPLAHVLSAAAEALVLLLVLAYRVR